MNIIIILICLIIGIYIGITIMCMMFIAKEADKKIEKMNKRCENCKHRKTMKCPNSSLCYDTESKPYFKER